MIGKAVRVDLPARGESTGATELDHHARVLRSRWRSASMASGWRFPSDWALPEADVVCAAVVSARGTVTDCGTETALAGLARARAAAGIGLSETLSDVAALHAVLQRPGDGDGFVAVDVDSIPARLVRITALGWADVALDKLANTEVTDPLTGLATLPYLRTRLAELYRAAEQGTAAHGAASAGPAHHRQQSLVVVQMDFSAAAGWCRLTGMIVVADVLATAFDSGESLASIGPSTVAALVPRDARLATRTLALRRGMVERFATDQQLADLAAPRIRVLGLPASHEAACELLSRVASA